MSDTQSTYLWQRRHEVKVRVLMNRMYYQERRRIFEWREGAVKAASIVAGSVAFASVMNPDIVKWCAAIITVASVASLTFSFGSKARDSAQRASEWIALERSIDLIGERDFTEDDINQWMARAHEIEASEPAAHQRLLNFCHRRACKTIGVADKDMQNQSGWFERHLPYILVP